MILHSNLSCVSCLFECHSYLFYSLHRDLECPENSMIIIRYSDSIVSCPLSSCSPFNVCERWAPRPAGKAPAVSAALSPQVATGFHACCVSLLVLATHGALTFLSVSTSSSVGCLPTFPEHELCRNVKDLLPRDSDHDCFKKGSVRCVRWRSELLQQPLVRNTVCFPSSCRFNSVNSAVTTPITRPD